MAAGQPPVRSHPGSPDPLSPLHMSFGVSQHPLSSQPPVNRRLHPPEEESSPNSGLVTSSGAGAGSFGSSPGARLAQGMSNHDYHIWTCNPRFHSPAPARHVQRGPRARTPRPGRPRKPAPARLRGGGDGRVLVRVGAGPRRCSGECDERPLLRSVSQLYDAISLCLLAFGWFPQEASRGRDPPPPSLLLPDPTLPCIQASTPHGVLPPSPLSTPVS